MLLCDRIKSLLYRQLVLHVMTVGSVGSFPISGVYVITHWGDQPQPGKCSSRLDSLGCMVVATQLDLIRYIAVRHLSI